MARSPFSPNPGFSFGLRGSRGGGRGPRTSRPSRPDITPYLDQKYANQRMAAEADMLRAQAALTNAQRSGSPGQTRDRQDPNYLMSPNPTYIPASVRQRASSQSRLPTFGGNMSVLQPQGGPSPPSELYGPPEAPPEAPGGMDDGPEPTGGLPGYDSMMPPTEGNVAGPTDAEMLPIGGAPPAGGGLPMSPPQTAPVGGGLPRSPTAATGAPDGSYYQMLIASSDPTNRSSGTVQNYYNGGLVSEGTWTATPGPNGNIISTNAPTGDAGMDSVYQEMWKPKTE